MLTGLKNDPYFFFARDVTVSVDHTVFKFVGKNSQNNTTHQQVIAKAKINRSKNPTVLLQIQG